MRTLREHVEMIIACFPPSLCALGKIKAVAEQGEKSGSLRERAESCSVYGVCEDVSLVQQQRNEVRARDRFTR